MTLKKGKAKGKVGKPLKFATPEDMEKAIDHYLKTEPFDTLTITGLALALGTSRQLLMDYERREGYAEIVKHGKCVVEHSYEVALRKNGRAGEIFALKNFGWSDKTEHEVTGPNGGPLQIITKGMTPEQASAAYVDTLHDE